MFFLLVMKILSSLTLPLTRGQNWIHFTGSYKYLFFWEHFRHRPELSFSFFLKLYSSLEGSYRRVVIGL